jgi:hypothetical protein
MLTTFPSRMHPRIRIESFAQTLSLEMPKLHAEQHIMLLPGFIAGRSWPAFYVRRISPHRSTLREKGASYLLVECDHTAFS